MWDDKFFARLVVASTHTPVFGIFSEAADENSSLWHTTCPVR